ncbi:zinc finger CCCH domain-containing protein 14-like [Hordeum vulgare subsp. vulgare]|uniref:C3H1-type domain-containing protein n=1 Tax=Hordeum vulgare subsp. vulgare TaxID=112509 RepID=A0A8I6YIK9_HORVV|nr:zinc finger CCCH domain-containing protein 14-like [Hordeum vulgare subsp. vulgare]
MSSAPPDDATVPTSIAMPRVGQRITYSRELLLAVGSSDACKVLPGGVDMSKHADDVKLWVNTETWAARSVGGAAPGRRGRSEELTQRAREPESFQAGVGSKSKPCLRFFSTAGCRFGDNCHFIHDIPGGYLAVEKMSILSGAAPSLPPAKDEEKPAKHLPMDNARSPPMEPVPTGDHALQARTAPDPGKAAVASFGASATAKICVDVSLVGAIIGRGGATIKQISRASGARLRVRDHDWDADLKNVELEGTFDQIKNAYDMAMEQLIHVVNHDSGGAPPPAAGGNKAAAGSLGSGWQLESFKTKLCGHFTRGCCTHGDGCRFAHGESELRRPVPAARDPCGW